MAWNDSETFRFSCPSERSEESVFLLKQLLFDGMHRKAFLIRYALLEWQHVLNLTMLIFNPIFVFFVHKNFNFYIKMLASEIHLYYN